MIPTAEEFIKSSELVVKFDNTSGCILEEELPHLLVQFAKMHVEAARKQFKIVFSEIDDVYPFERDDRLSDVYPLSNIK